MRETELAALHLARDLTADVERILAPREVLAAFRALASAHPGLHREVLGHDERGEPIEAYRWGHGPRATLWYAFPDPGEAVGGTGLLALLRGLVAGDARLAALDLTWHLLPCLNLADQPANGEALGLVMKTHAQEVDWCTHAPRPETTALLGLARATRPVAVFPLHDEFHCGEPLAVYAMVSAPLPDATCEAVRQALQAFGYAIDADTSDPAMGPGFARMNQAPDYGNSTFAVMAEAGLVFICEVSQLPGLTAAEMAGAQLAASLVALRHALTTGWIMP